MNISDFNKDQKPNFAGFEVIGAGLPRTGTNSLRTALNFLLDGAVYHMFQVAFGEKVDANFWEKALKRPMTKREWRDFLVGRGFRAGVDYPISMFYKYSSRNIYIRCSFFVKSQHSTCLIRF